MPSTGSVEPSELSRQREPLSNKIMQPTDGHGRLDLALRVHFFLHLRQSTPATAAMEWQIAHRNPPL